MKKSKLKKQRRKQFKFKQWTRLIKCFDDEGNPITFKNDWNVSGNYRFVFSDNGEILTADVIVGDDGRIVYIGASSGSSGTSIGRRVDDFIRSYCKSCAEKSNGFLLKQVKGFKPENLYVQFYPIDLETNNSSNDPIFESEQKHQQEYKEKYDELPCAHLQDNSHAREHLPNIQFHVALNCLLKTNIEEKDMKPLILDSNKKRVSTKSNLSVLVKLANARDTLSKTMNQVRNFEEQAAQAYLDELNSLGLESTDLEYLERVLEQEDPQSLSKAESIGISFKKKKSKKSSEKKKSNSSGKRGERGPNMDKDERALKESLVLDVIPMEKIKDSYCRKYNRKRKLISQDKTVWKVVKDLPIPTVNEAMNNKNHPVREELESKVSDR